MSQDFMPPGVRFAEWMRTAVYTETVIPGGRLMYDATGREAAGLVRFKPLIVAGYDTGSSGIAWSAQDWLAFPDAAHVHIDQGGAGAPSRTANVMDVEPGAYRPPDIPAWMAQSLAPIPTVYCDRTDLPAVQALYHGPVWLAWPGWNGEPLPRGNQVVAVQNVFTGTYDSSVVFDPAWPGVTPLPPPPPPPPPSEVSEMVTGMLNAGAEDFVPFPAGAFSRIYLFHDFTVPGSQVPVRIAVHSVAAGYEVIEHEITHSVPEIVMFTHSDVDGVSLANKSDGSVGWTLA